MKFLDEIGLAYFWEKIKNWVNINYLSLTGGTINGDVNISGNVSALQFKKTNGTSTQVLIADGSVKGINSANGVAGLDSNGYVPLAQLGNLDTTVAEVVTALPTTNIKKHIYLVKDASGVTQNQYEEYLYTGDISATYDASKWEKLGDFRATVDLADYAKKSEAVGTLEFTRTANYVQVVAKGIDGTEVDWPTIDLATSTLAGLMSTDDKTKLNGIAPNANNYSLPLAANGTRGGIQLGYAANGRNYPVQLSGEKAYVNVPWTDTNTTYGLATSKNDGLMSASDKAKIDSIDKTYAKKDKAINNINVNANDTNFELELVDVDDNPINYAYLPEVTDRDFGIMNPRDKLKLDNIADRATSDSAITTAEIDALFA